MSKYIPDNQKPLTLNDRIFMKNKSNKGIFSKTLSDFYAKIPLLYPKKLKTHRVSDWYRKGRFNNLVFFENRRSFLISALCI